MVPGQPRAAAPHAGDDAAARAHGCVLTGKMSGGGLRSVAWASVIALVECDNTPYRAGRSGRSQWAACKRYATIAPIRQGDQSQGLRGQDHDRGILDGWARGADLCDTLESWLEL